MPTWPLPGEYVSAGSGPHQLVRRDGNAQIPGVVTIIDNYAPAQVAAHQSRLTPSGWLTPLVPVGTADLPLPVVNRIGVLEGATAMLRGFTVPLPTSLGLIDLPSAPTSGVRYEQVFLEAFFVAITNGRNLVTRWRAIDDAVLATTPVFDENGASIPSTNYVPAASLAAEYPELANEANLYVGLLPGAQNDGVSQRNAAGVYKRLMFLLPALRVKRLNSTAYNASSNPNGAPAGPTSSARPDGLTHNYLRVGTQIVNAGSLTLPYVDADALLYSALEAVLRKRPQFKNGSGLAETVQHSFTGLNRDFANYASNIGVTRLSSVASNILTASNFRQDGNADGLADGWTAYTTGSATGTRSFLNPGQRIQRTGGGAADAFGVQQTVENVRMMKCRVRVLLTSVSMSGGAELVVEVATSENGAAIFTQAYTSAQLPGVFLDLPFSHSTWFTTCSVRVFLRNGTGVMDVQAIDVAGSLAPRPLMEVDTTGTIFTMEPSASVWDYAASGHTNGVDAHNGAAVACTYQVLVGGYLRFTVPSAPASSNFHVGVNTVYPPGEAGYQGATMPSGLLRVQGPDQGSLNELPYILVGQSQKTLTPAMLGISGSFAANESARIYNPATNGNGLCFDVPLVGNGSNTYSLPLTHRGFQLTGFLVSVKKNLGAGFVEAAVSTYSTSSRTIVLAATVPNGAPIILEASARIPFALYDPIGGVEGFYAAWAEQMNLTAPAPSCYVPSTQYTDCESLASGTAMKPLADAGGQTYRTTDATRNVVRVAPTGARVSPSAGNLASGLVTVFAVHRIAFDAARNPSGVNVFYAVPASTPFMSIATDADPNAASAQVRVLSRPVILSHTKGLGGEDVSSAWGSQPFVQDGSLAGGVLQLSGQGVGVSSVLEELQAYATRMDNGPLVPGRRVRVVQGATDFSVQGPLLGVSVAHEVVVAFLVEYAGLLMVGIRREVRTDNQNAVGPGQLDFYVLPGAPVAHAR